MAIKMSRDARRSFGQQFKIWRGDVGLTQWDVASKLGWSSPQFVSNIERGTADLPEEYFTAICLMFRISVTDLVQEIEKVWKASCEDSLAKLSKHV